jgi:hypothetical protein
MERKDVEQLVCVATAVEPWKMELTVVPSIESVNETATKRNALVAHHVATLRNAMASSHDVAYRNF